MFKQLLSTGKFRAWEADEDEELRYGPDGLGYTKEQYQDYFTMSGWDKANPVSSWKRNSVTRPQLHWKEDVDPEEDFEVVMLGDAVDRGSRSKEDLETIFRLTRHPRLGKKLIFLLGNHESYTLRYLLHWAEQDEDKGGWGKNARASLFFENEGSYHYEFFQWLRQCPVVYMRDHILMAHGGLSDATARLAQAAARFRVKKDPSPQQIIDQINNEAKEFYESVFQCVRKSGSSWFKPSDSECGYKSVPDVLENFESSSKARSSVLWFRGYTAIAGKVSDIGAGSVKACEMAAKVGEMLDVKFHVYAHSTHERIMQFCEDDALPVKVFAVDTSYKRCQLKDDDKECDYAMIHQHHVAPTSQWQPQSLHVHTNRETDEADIEACLYSTSTPNGRLCIPQNELGIMKDLGYIAQPCGEQIPGLELQVCEAGETCQLSCVDLENKTLENKTAAVHCPTGNIYRTSRPFILGQDCGH